MEVYVSGLGELGLTRRLPAKRYLNAGVAASCAIAVTPIAFGLSFGGERVLSYLGQPLRLAIPLLGATGDSLDQGCFRVVTPSRADGLAVISQARIELQTSSSPPLLIVRSSRAVDDPIVRVSVEAGCDNPIRRDYTILLDLPPVQANDGNAPRATPLVAPPLPFTVTPSTTASVTTSGAGQQGRDRAERTATTRTPRTPRSSEASADTKRSPRATSRSERTTPKSAIADEKSLRIDAKAATSPADQLRVQDGSTAGSSAVGDASLAALAVPRLKIASDLPSFGAAPAGTARVTDELQAAIASERRARLLSAPIEEDLSPRLEADLVVAKRRLAELQSQLTAAGLVTKSETLVAGSKNAKADVAVGRGWNWREWLWVPGVALVLGLIGFLLRQKRAQRETQKFGTAVVPTLRDEDVFEPTRPVASESRETQIADPMAAVATSAVSAMPTIPDSTPVAAAAVVNPLLRQPSIQVAEREASDRLNNPLFQLRDTTRHVDVTELSQVTDEAQVYVDLGRSDQAVEILRDHIENQQGERDSPAAWLMIFDLYRRTDNRSGYDELAPKFRTHFNGRMPDWDNYGHELALDDGLEAFPHLVAMLQRDWGTSEARKFLEELLYDNRGGSRLGFSLAAYRDILLLLQVHEAFDGEQSELASIIDWESRGANDDDGTPKWDLSLEMLEPPKVGELESFLRNRPPDDKS